MSCRLHHHLHHLLLLLLRLVDLPANLLRRRRLDGLPAGGPVAVVEVGAASAVEGAVGPLLVAEGARPTLSTGKEVCYAFKEIISRDFSTQITHTCAIHL